MQGWLENFGEIEVKMHPQPLYYQLGTGDALHLILCAAGTASPVLRGHLPTMKVIDTHF